MPKYRVTLKYNRITQESGAVGVCPVTTTMVLDGWREVEELRLIAGREKVKSPRTGIPFCPLFKVKKVEVVTQHTPGTAERALGLVKILSGMAR